MKYIGRKKNPSTLIYVDCFDEIVRIVQCRRWKKNNEEMKLGKNSSYRLKYSKKNELSL